MTTDPISMTNITGLRTMVRGCSLRMLSTSAGRTMAGSNSEPLAEGRCRTFGGRFCCGSRVCEVAMSSS